MTDQTQAMRDLISAAGRIAWNLQLSFWLMRYRYVGWLQPLHAYQWANAEEWQDWRESGETPRGAVLEDLSYGGDE